MKSKDPPRAQTLDMPAKEASLPLKSFWSKVAFPSSVWFLRYSMSTLDLEILENPTLPGKRLELLQRLLQSQAICLHIHRLSCGFIKEEEPNRLPVRPENLEGSFRLQCPIHYCGDTGIKIRGFREAP